MLIDGNQVRCEHICCPQCEAAVGDGWATMAAGYDDVGVADELAGYGRGGAGVGWDASRESLL
jgi:hypothetical protein